MNGYAGKILRIDLKKRKIKKEKLNKNMIRNYIGGVGISAKILYDEVGLIEPFSPDNKIIFGTGPLTGTFWPAAGRAVFCSLSPLTNCWGEAHIGGFIGPELKYAGYDFLILESRADKPVYISIEDDDVKILNAKEIWGKTTTEATEIIKGDGEVVCIGPAGENLVRYACIITNYSSAAGRCGIGAVMGSKKVKAIVVKGTKTIDAYDDKKFLELMVEAHNRLLSNEQNLELGKYGTPLLVGYKGEIGELPTKNHKFGTFSKAYSLTAEELRRKYFFKNKGCFSCRTGCKKIFKCGNIISGGPEYEGIMALGTNCLNSDFSSILLGNKLCNELGVDVISIGCTIAFAMECAENNLLNFKLKWGDSDAIVELIKKIAYREGIGKLLAEGTMRAAKKIGKGAKKYAMEVKGMEISGQDGRAHRSAALTHAISVRGADHLRSLVTVDQLGYKSAAEKRFGKEFLPEICDPHSEKYKAIAVAISEEVYAIRDSIITCWYTCAWPPIFWIEDFSRALFALTGMKEFCNEKNLINIGRRIVNIRRLFNVRRGFMKNKDRLPKRFTHEPMPSGPSKGQVVDINKMLSDYYKLRNWDENGIPNKSEAIRLGLRKEWKSAMENKNFW
ncbi:MAG: aldehyde ferredoxin oxidoreductase family protein [Candidatus Thermoplasmatota archaeon]